jgi:uncharacterized protein YkwD
MPRFVVKSRTLFALVFGGFVFLVLAPGALSATFRGQAAVSSQEQNLLRSINQARARHGAPPLRIASALQRAARSHSRTMLRTGNFTHGDWYRRLRRYGANSQKLGETIAWGVGSEGTASAIVRTWLASPPHRSTLLDRGFRYVGVGVAVGSFGGYGGTSMATADFGGR